MSLESCLQRQDIWRGQKKISAPGLALTTGFAILDHHLPNGGWPLGALTEILVKDVTYSPLWLVLPALAALAPQRSWQAWVTPPTLPYPLGLSQGGLDLSKILLVRPTDRGDTLWSTEQSLRSRACSAVLCWPNALHRTATRRLQLAAEHGGTLGICFQNHTAADSHSMAALRLYCRSTACGLEIDLIKCRGGPLYQGLTIQRPADSDAITGSDS
ncbi:MAG: SOS cell division inhibitor SulA [Acidiferrobacteraceae bacterium]|nr:SOS cell division inhibitor SulA [Acidiferrobacteraceae bacterium]MCP4828728.1 translesion DNA synthesis-associated protein ImuA [Pseudomonadota bacterium]MDP6950224.1 translesion DNA synthesis-associated protein ImuA [Arenicellales bacterium]HJP07767.1 translesion DNA synthesis-associated protein ImuA [Arenicellales bacterium]